MVGDECDVLPQKEIVERYSSLSQWPAFKLLGIEPYFVGKRPFFDFYFMVRNG